MSAKRFTVESMPTGVVIGGEVPQNAGTANVLAGNIQAITPTLQASDGLRNLEIRLKEIAEDLRRNNTVRAYEQLRQAEEYIAYLLK